MKVLSEVQSEVTEGDHQLLRLELPGRLVTQALVPPNSKDAACGHITCLVAAAFIGLQYQSLRTCNNIYIREVLSKDDCQLKES